jgi:DNA-binding HxlR family transcriptional regulator
MTFNPPECPMHPAPIPAEDDPVGHPCPIRNVLDRIGDQWSLLVLDALDGRTRRFNELMRDLGDVSKQMLSQTLKRLEEDGFVRRTLYPEVPPRVEYDLTPLGQSFMVPMKALVAWADTHHALVRDARRAYRSPPVARAAPNAALP